MKVMFMALALTFATALFAGSASAQEPSKAKDPAKTQDAGKTTQGQKDIVETVMAADNFKTLAKAIQTAGLTDTLKSGTHTIFAPTDEAFAKLPAGTLDSLMQTPEKLKKVLLNHVVTGRVTSDEVTKMKSTKTVEGAELKISSANNKVMLDKATVVNANIAASNGVIHAIDTVLMPEMQASR